MSNPAQTTVTPQNISSIGTTNEGGTVVSGVQSFPTGVIYRSDADKTFSTYELSELKRLPKSLFYDAATSDGVYRGLFAYYVLGAGKGVRYHNSESTQALQEITKIESRNPTASQIIKTVSGGAGQTPAYLDPTSPYRGQVYNVKDFIFCKYYGIIPNNRMLTLRRFAYPALDSLRVLKDDSVGNFVVGKDGKPSYEKQSIQNLGIIHDKDASKNTSLPVSQLVTFFGGDTGNSLSTILGISTGLNFSSQTQETTKNEQTGDPGLMNSPYGDLIKSAITSGEGLSETNVDDLDKLFSTMLTPEKNITALQRALLDQAVSADGPLSKKIFVNVNTVDKVMTRVQGFPSGMDPFSLNFHYTLNSAGEVNSKLLFLDLMTNVFSLASDYGQFLAPEIRIQQTNLGMGFPGGPKGYAKSITDPIGYLRDMVSRMLSKEEVDRQLQAEKGVTDDITQIANEMKNFIYDPDKGLSPDSKLYKSISVMLSDAFLKKVYYSPLLLSGYPTGEWHLTIGNPLNPIAMMGNLVCNNVKINFNDELGPDDFPTEMTVSIQLTPGRQRHRGDWESMFNRGNGRLYLGQLTSSNESTRAWTTTQGINPNDTRGKNIYDITNENVDQLTQGNV